MVAALAFVAPTVAFAAPKTFAGLVAFIVGYINLLIPIIITLAIIYYMWNTVQGMWKLKDGKVDADWSKSMLYGIIAIALMVSIWGVLRILASTFKIQLG